MMYNRVALIGLGLIASSMFWGIKRGQLAGEVTGFARSEATRDTAPVSYTHLTLPTMLAQCRSRWARGR